MFIDFESEHNYALSGKINEECGVFGVYNVAEASSLTYFGLHALQHRGQQAAGIASCDFDKIRMYKERGLLSEIFDSGKLEKLVGEMAVGHVRYSTASSNLLENTQPIMVRAHQGDFCVVHNGNITNAPELKRELEKSGSIFNSKSDSEIIAHLIVKEKGSFVEKIQKAAKKLDGAFAFIIMVSDKMYCVRDKNGLRPLSIAKKEDGYVISSETCAFDIINAQFIRDVEPGEVIRIDQKTLKTYKYTEDIQRKMCSMEYIYFSRPDSIIEGINVHTARRISGRALAEVEDVEADIVIGVPDSSLSAAIGYAEKSGLPYEMGLIKNRYVGRTFIQPTQKQRERGVKMKLSAVGAIVKDKRIILVDDSIVRGTTSKRIVQLLKEAGAKEVHIRIGSPPMTSPCFYGVDTSSYNELISHNLSVEEVREFIGADSLRFLTIEEMCKAFGTENLCVSCFNGIYPTPLHSFGEIVANGK